MRLVQFPKACRPAARPLLFTSPKCRVSIPVNDPLLRCALEQASLDPSVRQIDYRVGPQVECPPISLKGVVLRREDGSFLLRVHQSRPKRTEDDDARLNFVLERHGLRLLELVARDICSEPLFSNSRAVWSHAGRYVSLTDRLGIGLAMDEGPLTIRELEHRAPSVCDVVTAVCSLACENLLRLNLDVPLGPRTMVLAI